MCYSSKIEADYRRYLRETGGRLSYDDFRVIFWERTQGRKIKVPRGMEQAFLAGESPDDREIAGLIEAHRQAEATRLQQDLFAQRARLAEAERKLATKPTKTAAESMRIATAKVAQYLAWLADLNRTESRAGDSRIFPGVYAYVLIVENGDRVVKPMRYGCRPAGKPANYDFKFPGTYNARRDNLEAFWRGQFGRTHGVALWWYFYEHVVRDGQDVVLEFSPSTGQLMPVACLYSHWTPPAGSDERELWSFAAITDDPPPEVAAAGHDRCIIPLKGEHLDRWLNPDPADLAAQQAVLDDRERYFYEHRMAA
jgi:putative SOS response-associated peptidase YedK